jgi:nucleoside 2-deoxyribosyltransferase
MSKYLDGRNVYLAGPIHGVSDDGTTWRNYLTPILENTYKLQVVDPCKKTTCSGVVEVADDKKRFKQLINEEKWEEIKTEFYPIVRKDLRCVDKADFIIALYDPTIHSVGTIHEIIESAHQKKPILIKYDKAQLDKFNPWITCLIKPQWLFSEWEKMFKYLDKINDGIIETSHWGLD